MAELRRATTEQLQAFEQRSAVALEQQTRMAAEQLRAAEQRHAAAMAQAQAAAPETVVSDVRLLHTARAVFCYATHGLTLGALCLQEVHHYYERDRGCSMM